jgi:nucleoid-associated protein YgaU
MLRTWYLTVAWLIDGRGFVEAATTRVIADTIANVDIPAAGGTPEVPPSPPQPDEPASGVEYVTQAGDTLWSIAERFYGDGTRRHKIYAVPRKSCHLQECYAGAPPP